MNISRRVFLVILFFPVFLQAQFGPKKKELQLQIDTLRMTIDQQQSVISNLRFRDSVSFTEIKRLGNEMRDLKKLMIELNADIRKLTIDYERLENENKALMEKVERHEKLIQNVIGEDSLDIEQKEDDASTFDNEDAESVQNFAEFATEFMVQIKQRGEVGLKDYLGKAKTFYYLSKPGFITSVAEISDVNELTEEIPWRTGLDAFKKSKYRLIEGEKPEINCEMVDLYNKIGVYGGIEENFEKVSKALLAAKEFSPDEDFKLNGEIDQIKKSEKRVVSFIFSTDGNLGFYFIKEDNTWQLYCLEIEDPCSA